VEKENERISQEFRDTFAQNAVRMEDSLTRFVNDHAKFLGDVSANYGAMLEKQGRDLSSLSELMSSLVKSQSQYAEGIHKAAADSTHASQEFVKVFLGTTRTQVNSQTASHHQFLIESFLPKLQMIAATMQEQGQAVQQLQRTLTVRLGPFFFLPRACGKLELQV
jgi:adenylosuccinate lyase